MRPAPIYFDWNATTPPCPEVLQAMAEASTCWANPASVHALGRRARAVVELARETLAEVMGVHPRDLLFTSGGTEANNLALHAAPMLITSRLEHPSVVRIAEALAEHGSARWLPVTPSGRIDPVDLERTLVGVPPQSWVSVAVANHETGVLQPIAELAEVAHRAGALLHTDAVQALGKVEPDVWQAADALTVCAHKIRGPKGIGALAWRQGATPLPLLRGGAQERGLRPGSQDAVLAAGFRAAVEALDVTRFGALSALRDRLERRLALQGEVNGCEVPRLPHVTNVSVRGWRSDELVAALDLGGVCASAGSACSAGTIEPSPVIEAMVGVERAARAVRISLGPLTTSAEIETALLVLDEVLGPLGDAQLSSIA